MRPWSYLAAGVGVVGLGAFAGFGALAQSRYNDLQRACYGGPCPSSKSDEISAGKTDVLLANVGLAVGIVGIAAGATLFIVSLPKGAPASHIGLSVSPAGLGIRGWLW